ERDDAARRAVLEADVKEARGQGTARAKMEMEVTAAGDGASVAAVTDVQMSGRAAQMGAGLIEDVASRLVDQMAANLRALLATAPAASAAGGAASATGGAAAGAGAPASATPSSPPPPPAKPVNGFGLLLKALADRLRRLFTKEPR